MKRFKYISVCNIYISIWHYTSITVKMWTQKKDCFLAPLFELLIHFFSFMSKYYSEYIMGRHLSSFIFILRKCDDSFYIYFLTDNVRLVFHHHSCLLCSMQSFANIYSLLMSASYYVSVTHLFRLSSRTPTFISVRFMEPICAFYGLISLFPFSISHIVLF